MTPRRRGKHLPDQLHLNKMPPELVQAIRARAYHEDTTLTDVVIRALSIGMQVPDKPAAPPTALPGYPVEAMAPPPRLLVPPPMPATPPPRPFIPDEVVEWEDSW